MGLESITGMAVSIADNGLQLPAAIAFSYCCTRRATFAEENSFILHAGLAFAAALMGLLYLFKNKIRNELIRSRLSMLYYPQYFRRCKGFHTHLSCLQS